MKNKTFLLRLCKTIIGHKVTSKRLAGNSLILYVECEPGDRKGFGIWLDPPWNLTGPSGIITGSHEIGRYSWRRNDKRFEKVGDELHSLFVGKKMLSIKINRLSNDMTLVLESQYTLKTFNTDPADFYNMLWRVFDHKKDMSVLIYSNRIRIDRTPKKWRVQKSSENNIKRGK